MGMQLWQKVGIGVGVVAVIVTLVGAGWYGTRTALLPTPSVVTTRNGIHQGPQDGSGQRHGVNGTQPHLGQGDQATQNHGQRRGNGRGNTTQSVDQ